MLRQGSGEPLLLLHGVMGGPGMWRRVLPWVAPFHDTIAPAALGHRGGSAAAVRPAELRHVVDDAERLLDELGFDRVHIAGNSMGGFMALELARRGRARSVCALSPAGAWQPGARRPRIPLLRLSLEGARRTRAMLPVLSHLPLVRRLGLVQSAANGHRVSRTDFLELVDDLLACTIAEDLFATREYLAPLDPLPCPVTLAWSERDLVFPIAREGARAQKLIPGARFVTLTGLGHVPMLDDPRRVAEVILETARTAQA